MLKIIFAGVLLFAVHALVANPTLVESKAKHNTKLVKLEKVDFPLPEPPNNFQLIEYISSVGKLPALVSIPEDQNRRHPAIIWLVGGFSNSISEIAWADEPQSNDQSASVFWKNGVVTMYPCLRGGNNGPGYVQSFYGEVDDVINAAKALKKLDYVDPDRIYLGGHSTGGTLALLVAESTNEFRAVFSFGPVTSPYLYGEENLNYDMSSFVETQLRSPLFWLHDIESPTFIFEGENGNIDPLRLMQSAIESGPNDAMVKTFPIPDHDHFDILYPLSRMIALAIIDDSGNESTISFSESDVEQALGK